MSSEDDAIPDDVRWVLDRRVAHERVVLRDAAADEFDDGDTLTQHTLAAVYLQESAWGTDFGVDEKPPGEPYPAGHFQLGSAAAEDVGLAIPDDATRETDPRFEFDAAAPAAAAYLDRLEAVFADGATLTEDLDAVRVPDPVERKRFALAAYNKGAGRIAQAQAAAADDDADPTSWSDVAEYVDEAGLDEAQAEEVRAYVPEVLANEAGFAAAAGDEQHPPVEETGDGGSGDGGDAESGDSGEADGDTEGDGGNGDGDTESDADAEGDGGDADGGSGGGDSADAESDGGGDAGGNGGDADGSSDG